MALKPILLRKVMIMPHVRLKDGTLAYLLVRDTRTHEIGFVSGGVRDSETFEQAAVRELHEETAGAVLLPNLKGHWRVRYRVVTQTKARCFLCDYACYILDVTGRLDPSAVKREYRRRLLGGAAPQNPLLGGKETRTPQETPLPGGPQGTQTLRSGGLGVEAPQEGGLGGCAPPQGETCEVLFERITDVPQALMWTVCADVMRSQPFRCAHGYFASRSAPTAAA
jgi:hypothetical protein